MVAVAGFFAFGGSNEEPEPNSIQASETESSADSTETPTDQEPETEVVIENDTDAPVTPESPEASEACTVLQTEFRDSTGLATTVNGEVLPPPATLVDNVLVFVNAFDMSIPADGGPLWIWLALSYTNGPNAGDSISYTLANDSRAVHGPPHPDASPYFMAWDAETNSTTGTVELSVEEYVGGESQGRITEPADFEAIYDGTNVTGTVSNATVTIEFIAEQPPIVNGQLWSSPECYLEAVGELREIDNPTSP